MQLGPINMRPSCCWALADDRIHQGHETWQPATAVYLPTRNAYGVTLTDDATLNYRGLRSMARPCSQKEWRLYASLPPTGLVG